jgi:hypothetical protein
MAQDIKMWTGAAWQSLKGANGAPGPTVVSADVGSVAKLGSDGHISVQPADMDARFVNTTGDTMTGPLIVKPAVGPANPDGGIQIIGDNTNAALSVKWANAANGNGLLRFARSRGTIASPLPVQNSDQIGLMTFQALRDDSTASTYSELVRFAVLVADGANVSGTDIKGRLNINVNDGAGLKTPLTIDGTLVNFQFPVTLGGGITGNLQLVNNAFIIAGTQAIAQVSETLVAFSKPVAIPNGINGNATVLSGGSVFVVDGVVRSTRNSTDPNASISAGSFTVSGVGKTVVGVGASVLNGVGTDFTAALQLANNTNTPTCYSIYSGGLAQSVIQGKLGLNRFSPTSQLDVGGDAIVRGPLEVTGNITSAGTAHNFAASSIPSSAVIGNVPRTIAATGSAGVAGQMVWDENFLYIHTLSGWKKVALTAI